MKKTIYIISILLVVIIAVLIFQYNSEFNLFKVFNSFKPEVKNNLSYSLVDNTEEFLKTLVKIERDDNIESIEYTDVNGNIVILNPVNKSVVGIDLKVKVAEEMPFKIISNGLEEIEKLYIPSDYINNYIVLTKDINNSTEQNYIFSASYRTDLENETVNNYYTIGNRSNWTKYTSPFNVTISDISDFTTGQTTIHLKEETENEEKVIRDYIENAPLTGDFEIFRNALAVSGEDPTKYGITCTSKTNCESYWFDNLSKIGGGHSSGTANYSCTFNIDFQSNKNFLNRMETPTIEVSYVLFGNSHTGKVDRPGFHGYLTTKSTSAAIATIHYTDGTTDQKSTEKKCWGDSEITGIFSFSVDTSKEINNITLTIDGHDDDYTNSYGYFSNITLKDCDFSNFIVQP